MLGFACVSSLAKGSVFVFLIMTFYVTSFSGDGSISFSFCMSCSCSLRSDLLPCSWGLICFGYSGSPSSGKFTSEDSDSGLLSMSVAFSRAARFSCSYSSIVKNLILNSCIFDFSRFFNFLNKIWNFEKMKNIKIN